MKNFLNSLLSGAGKISSMRLSLMTGVVMIMFLVGLIGYIVFERIDMNYIDKIIFAIGTIAGIFITGKVTQKYAEVKDVNNITSEISIENQNPDKNNPEQKGE